MKPRSKVPAAVLAAIAITVGFAMVGLASISMMGCGRYICGMTGMGNTGRMASMGREEMAQPPLTEGRKKVGEGFTCPIDGMQMKVTEETPATEYRGKTHYFCNEEERRAFLKDPVQYAKGW